MNPPHFEQSRQRALMLSPVFAFLTLSSLAGAQTPAAPPTATPTTAPTAAPTTPSSAGVNTSSPSNEAAPATPPTNETPSPSAAAPPPSPATSGTEVLVTPLADPPKCRPTPAHEGFYLRIASGPAYVSVFGDGPSGSASISGLGSGATISLGGSIEPGLVLAGTLQVATTTNTFKRGPLANATLTSNGAALDVSHKADAGFAQLGLLIDWYPRPLGGWHAGAAAGIGATTVVTHADDKASGGLSFSGTAFGGYDWALGSEWSMGLMLVAGGATSATMKNSSGGGNSGYKLTPLALGIQAAFLYF